MLLCGSVLAFNLSDQFAASNEAVQKEQSRLLAYSGWNLALEQLQLYGQTDCVERAVDSGTVSVSFCESSTALSAWEIVSTGEAGVYHKTVSGIVQCFLFPFAETADWPVAASLQELTSAGILLVEDSEYRLDADCSYPIGIAAASGRSIAVSVQDEITVDVLYVSGDLFVSEPLHAEKLYVTGEIYEEDLIDCAHICSGWEEPIPYQIRVLQRETT